MTDSIRSPYKGSGQITREQFLFYEMRTTAKLIQEGLDEDGVIDKIIEDHLADQMISIDLDDGVKHNYALFQDVLAKIK